LRKDWKKFIEEPVTAEIQVGWEGSGEDDFRGRNAQSWDTEERPTHSAGRIPPGKRHGVDNGNGVTCSAWVGEGKKGAEGGPN